MPIILAKHELAAIFRPKIIKHQTFHKYGHVTHHMKSPKVCCMPICLAKYKLHVIFRAKIIKL